MSTNQTTLDGMRVLMEALDNLHDSFENIITISKKYEVKLQPFSDTNIFNQDAIQQTLGEMAPERASALAIVLINLSNLVPTNEQNGKKELENFIQLLKTIRANLHIALDEKS